VPKHTIVTCHLPIKITRSTMPKRKVPAKRGSPGFQSYKKNKEKLLLLDLIEERFNKGESKRYLCKEYGIATKQEREWRRKKALIETADPESRSLNKGGTPLLEPFNEDLVSFIKERKADDLVLDVASMISEVIRFIPEFEAERYGTQKTLIWRWFKQHNYSWRAITSQGPKSKTEQRQKALSFVEAIRPMLVGNHVDFDFVINMDQTALFFAPKPRRSYAPTGSKRVFACTPDSASSRATGMMTICASGKKLQLLIVYQASTKGPIRKSLVNFPKGAQYTTQKKGWTNKVSMLCWVDKVLAPYIATKPEHVIPIVVLDSHSAHKTKKVRARLTELGCQVHYIAGGCTDLTQPINLVMNKPLKDRLRKLFNAWHSHTVLAMGNNKVPSREQLAEWAIEAWNSISSVIAKSGWSCNDTAIMVNLSSNKELQSEPE
jgi:DDE superfamily endonuclease